MAFKKAEKNIAVHILEYASLHNYDYLNVILLTFKNQTNIKVKTVLELLNVGIKAVHRYSYHITTKLLLLTHFNFHQSYI